MGKRKSKRVTGELKVGKLKPIKSMGNTRLGSSGW